MALILVVDDHSVYRSGLRGVIEARVQQACVFETSDLSVMREYVKAKRYFDLVLIDSKSLSHHSLGLVREVHELSPATRFAVMSTSNTRADVLTCLSAGFHGFVNKLQSAEEILAAVNDLLSGRIYVPRWLADGDDSRADVEAHSWKASPVDMFRLTPRQNEVLTLLAQGMSNKEIANKLHISEGTAKIHTAGLLRAIGARNRTEAAFKAANLLEANNRAVGQTQAATPNPKRLNGTSA